MDGIKNEFINFMENKYKNIILRKSIFYNCEYALRFDLHDIAMNKGNDEYFTESLHRADELFYNVFCNCDELYFIYRNGKIKWNDKIFKNIIGFHKKEIGIFNEENVYEENFHTQLAVLKVTASRINYRKILESINNTDFSSRKPRTGGEIYFIHIKDEIIFNMYDDRGLDIVGTTKEIIKPYYLKYNKWLLEDNREKMNKIFK
ncbi:MAG: DUF3885 domain-containing protein [Spirochaetaceae bacterium]|jgi:hypothetical protein|nr:DUF3885 domain-containing protein [Spirochaetaceae bacterium]